MKEKWLRRLSICLLIQLVILIITPIMPLFNGIAGPAPIPQSIADAAGPDPKLPSISIPTGNVPEIHEPKVIQAPEIKQMPSPNKSTSSIISGSDTVAGSAAVKSRVLKAKDIIGKVFKMTIGSQTVLYKAANQMDNQGGFNGKGWGFVRQYVLHLGTPWLDLLPIPPQINTFMDGLNFAGKTREVIKFIDSHQILQRAATSQTASLKLNQPNFSIFGGTISMIFGSMQVVDSLQSNEQTADDQQTGKFYAGLGDVISGLGIVVGGIASLAAGTAIAPVLAAAGAVLFTVGLVFSAAGYGLNNFAWFRNSRLGKGFTRIKNRIRHSLLN